MPISSGANGWPTSHTSNLLPGQPNEQIIVVKNPPPPSPVKVVRVKPAPRPPKPRDKSCCGGTGSCGPLALYTTGIAGANAGCCTGGLFSRRKYPFNPKNPYILKGNGCRRCCACVAGLVFAVLLLTALLTGLVWLKPYLESLQVQNAMANDPAVTYTDGVYYYVAPAVDYYYKVVGADVPCRPDPTAAPTAAAATTVTDSTDTVSTVTQTEATTTAPAVTTTLPLCSDLTTSFLLLQRPTNALPQAVQQLQAAAAIRCGCAHTVAFLCIMAYVFIRQLMHI